jgi:hypothetical protein
MYCTQFIAIIGRNELRPYNIAIILIAEVTGINIKNFDETIVGV